MADYEVSTSRVNWHFLDDADDEGLELASPSQQQTSPNDFTATATPTAAADTSPVQQPRSMFQTPAASPDPTGRTLHPLYSSNGSTNGNGNGSTNSNGKAKKLQSTTSSAASGSELSEHDETDDINTIVAPDIAPLTHRPSPYAKASFWSILSFHWLNDLIRLGARKPLEEIDLYALMPKEQALVRMQELDAAIKRVEERKKRMDAEAEAEKSKQPVNNVAAPVASAPPLSTDATSIPIASEPPSTPSELSSLTRRPRLSLWLALGYQFGPHYAKLQLLLFIYIGSKILQPLMLNQLVQFVGDPSEPAWHGYLYGASMGIGAFCQALVHHSYFFHAARVGVDIRIALNAVIYKKALELRTTHMMKTTTGQVINLVSNDSAKGEDLSIYLPYLWNCPVECAIVLAILYQQIGVAAFTGFAAILCLTPVQMYFSKLFARYRRYTVSRTDARVKTINEILIAADVMKMMNWESSLEAKVNQVRHEEFSSISNAAMLKSINQAAFFASLSVVSLVAFFTMHFRGVTFTPANVFTTISLFNVIKFPLTNFIPVAVEKLTEANISFRRIANFLALDDAVQEDEKKYAKILGEVKKQNEELLEISTDNKEKYAPGSLHMKAASFVWELNDDLELVKSVNREQSSLAASPPLLSAVPSAVPSPLPSRPHSPEPSMSSPALSRQGLQYLDISIQPGTLVGVIGSIGSYKSSFLAACLGEMTQIHGGQLIQGRLSYASQTAWIFAGTIRENILFGRPFDAQRYLRTIRSCQLVDDIKMCPYGDQTQIGEKGVNLSGGQRARLSCARAVYSDADIYLFDDPLAALDAVVARKLYDSVMSNGGMLAGKTRILVTHQTHLLTHAHIIMLDHGRIACQGSFDHLVQAGFLREEQKYATHDNDSSMEAADVKRRKKEARRKREKQREDKKKAALNGVVDVKAGAVEPGTLQVDKNAIVRNETSVVGNLDPMVFIKLFRSGGGVPVAVFVLILVTLGQGCSIYADKWLANWSGMSAEDQAKDINAWVFLGLVGGTIVLGLARSRVFFMFMLRAASSLHESMFHAVVYSPMRFFEANPVGRILNRFSKDQSIIDEMLPFTFFDFTQCFFMVLGALVVVGISAPFVLLIVIPIIPLFIWVRQRFLATNRELKRLDATTRSPVYALFSSTLSGLMTIRSFNSEQAFMQNFVTRLDDNMRPFILVLMSARWFGLRLDVLAASVVVCLGLLIAGTRGTISPSNAGFALSYCLLLTSLFQWAVRQSAEVETMMTAVERVCEYSELKHEGELINPDYRPAPGWPSQGVIEFKDYKMRYRPGLDLVLKGVNLRIAPGEKVGVCGRTGAGKSSLFQALLRLVEADSGSIEIDGMEIGKLGLSDLRSNLAIIPQYPVIFSGSLRYNLDPFSRCSDAEIWSALESVQLAKMVQGLKDQLLEEMAEFGTNFSVGECQLICVARALLKPSKVLCVDEATANVDSKTDQLIQTVIREKFKDRTVLTIAHRLNTILDCEKIVVMAAGRVAEFGSPAELLARPPADLITEPDATYGLFAFMANQKKAAQ